MHFALVRAPLQNYNAIHSSTLCVQPSQRHTYFQMHMDDYIVRNIFWAKNWKIRNIAYCVKGKRKTVFIWCTVYGIVHLCCIYNAHILSYLTTRWMVMFRNVTFDKRTSVSHSALSAAIVISLLFYHSICTDECSSIKENVLNWQI